MEFVLQQLQEDLRAFKRQKEASQSPPRKSREKHQAKQAEEEQLGDRIGSYTQ